MEMLDRDSASKFPDPAAGGRANLKVLRRLRAASAVSRSASGRFGAD